MTDPKVLSAQSIHEFFRELLSLAIENQRARVQQATELYLANLLSGFLQTESLLVREEDGSLQRRILVFTSWLNVRPILLDLFLHSACQQTSPRMSFRKP